mgnify:CR=1 FL=1
MSHKDARVDVVTDANRRPEDGQAPVTTVFTPFTVHVVFRGVSTATPFCVRTIVPSASSAFMGGGGTGAEGGEGGEGGGEEPGSGQQFV